MESWPEAEPGLGLKEVPPPTISLQTTPTLDSPLRGWFGGGIKENLRRLCIAGLWIGSIVLFFNTRFSGMWEKDDYLWLASFAAIAYVLQRVINWIFQKGEALQTKQDKDPEN